MTSRRALASREGDPLRIAVVSRPWIEVPPRGHGGVERICATLVNELVHRGHDVTLIGVGCNGTDARFHATYPVPQLHHGVSLIPELAHAARVRRLLSGAQLSGAQFDSAEFDIVHDHTLIGPILGPLGKTPTVCTVHDPVLGEDSSDSYTLLGDYYQALGDNASLVSISHAQRNDRPELNWVGTVYNGIDTIAHPDIGLGNPAARDDFVLWVGRFIVEKGPDLAISACREAGLPLVLAGSLDEPKQAAYFSLVIEPLLGSDVEVVTNAGHERIIELMSRARCLLHPIRFREPFGLVLAEAAACGTPVVGLNRGAVAEVVADGITGWVCRRTDELAEALRRVVEIDPAACRARAKQLFSVEAMARGYERIYREAVDR